MAEKKRSGRGKGIPHHPLVEALAPDPNQPPEQATKLFGYPGPAADANSTRLWLDTDLTTYVEIPDDAIVHSQTLDNDQGTTLWVEPSATLTHSTTQSQEVQAEFLGGAIAEGNLAAAAPGPELTALGSGPLPESIVSPCFRFPPSVIRPCLPTTDPPCRISFAFPCISSVRWCPTAPEICEPLHSRLRPCVSIKEIHCPQLVATKAPPCPAPWEEPETPVVNPVGPFRPQR